MGVGWVERAGEVVLFARKAHGSQPSVRPASESSSATSSMRSVDLPSISPRLKVGEGSGYHSPVAHCLVSQIHTDTIILVMGMYSSDAITWEVGGRVVLVRY